MRASMATESIFGMRDLLPSISRMAYNSTRRAESSWLRASNKTKMRMLTKEVSEIKKLDLDTNIRRRAEAQQSISDIQTQIKDVENLIKRRQRKMFARRDAGDAKGKADAEASMQEAIDMRNGLLSALDDAMEQADRAEAAVNVAAAVLKEKRDEMYSITSKIYDADTAIKRIGEDKWTLDVDGVKYELDGLLDPNVKGVGAYLSEVDASQSYIAATAKSAFGRRIANQRRQWTKIKLADGDAYFNALAHIANRQLRNDEVARMVLQGRSKEDILQWLVTPAGNKYLRDMSGRWGVPDDAITSNALEQWVTHVYDTIDNMYAKDPVIKNLILERNVSTEEMRDLLSTRLPEELLPEINGPAINMMDLNGIEKTIAWTESKTDYLWGKLVGVETRLVRNPLFKKYVADSLARQVRYARANGIDVTQDIVNNQMRQVAYRDALDRVESVLYSARRMTNGGHIARYLMAFPTAYFNSQKTALKLLAKNPYNAYWYTRVTNATDVFGVYEDREGNKYTSIQDVPDGTAVTVQVPIYSKDSPEWLKPYMDPRGGGIKLNPKQFEFMIGDPSVSFIGAFSLSSIVMGAANNSVFGVYGEDIVQGLRKTFGDDFYESSIAYGGYLTSGETTGQRVVDTMVPPWMRSLLNAYKGARGDEEGFYGDTMFTSSVNATYKNAVAEWYRNGAVGTEPSYADAVKTAGFFALAKSFIQFNSFFSITFDPVTAAMTRYYGNSLDANGGDTERTEAEMVERFGIDVLAMLGSSSKNTGKFASTMEDIKIIRNHKDLLLDIYQKTNRPDLAGMLSGNYGEITNKYSTEVAALYRNMDYPGTGMDLVDTRTPKQIQEDAQVRMGWFEYSRAIDWRDAKMAELGIKSTYETGYRTSGLKAAMDQINEQLKTAYPRWNEARDNDRKNFREQTLVALKRITSDKKWMQEQEGPKWIEIALWVDAAENFYQEYDKLRAAGVRTTGLKQEFARWHYDYVSRKSTEFGEFSARWLTGMQELLDEEDIVNG